MIELHGIYCQQGLAIGGYTLALYDAPWDEQIRVLALAKGHWQEDEMVGISGFQVPPGMEFASEDARERASLFLEARG